MQDTPLLLEHLGLRGKRLSKSHRAIADYIEAHYDKAGALTAVALGKQCGVSESTVVRFAMALGYEGYPELQAALQELARQRMTAVQRFDMASELTEDTVLKTVLKNDMSNIRRTVEELSQADFDDAVARLLGARHIYVMGLRSAAPLAQFLGHYLHLIFEGVTLVTAATGDVFEELARVGPQDVLVGISFPRYSTRTLEGMRFAREQGAQVVGITDGAMSPLCEAANVCLRAHTDMASFVDSLAAPLSVINALIVALGLQRRAELSDHFKRLEGIWNAQRIYIDKEHG